MNALIDQQFTANINIIPNYGDTRLIDVLRLLNEKEMAELLTAVERATWPKIPAISATTRIGRTLDQILHEFEVDEAHWLRSTPQTDAALKEDSAVRIPRRDKAPASIRRSKRPSSAIEKKAAASR